MAYIGQAPFQEFTSVPTKDNFTGDGSTTAFDLSAAVPVGSENALEVFVNNVRQEPGSGKAFTLGQDGSGDFKRITFASAPTDGHAIYVINDRTSFTSIAPLPQDLNGSELILDADADTSITASTDDQIDFKIGGADEIIMTATALSPATANGNALGTAALEWADLFLSDGAVINFGADQDVSLTHVHNDGLLLSSTDKLQFNDASQFIHGSSATVLSLGATDEIDLTATAIDINGTCDVSGAFTTGSTIVATGVVTAAGFTIGSAVINEAELETIDGITAGTVIASKALVADANIDITGGRNITISGELDAATLDISGNADIDGTLEADAITINGTAIGSIYGVVAGSSSIVTVGAVNAGSITSGFTSIDVGAGAITTTGVITGGTVEATTDTAAGDNAAIGYTSAEGLILTGQGSTSDVVIKNDADATVFSIATGTTTGTFAGTVLAKTDTDTSNTGSVTLDFTANQNFVLTLTGNTTLANPSTEQVGQSGFIACIQDGTGSRTLSLGTDYETAGAAGISLTTTAAATDLIPYLVVAANRILLGTPQLAFS